MSTPTVVALGDSITLGVGDGTQRPDGTVGWAALTAHALGAARFTNLAANGARARDVLATQVAPAVALRPDIVLLTVGGNDVLRGDFSPAEIAQCLGQTVTLLSAPGRVIAMVSLDRIGLFDLAPRRVAKAMARRVGEANAALTAGAAGRVLMVDGASLMASHGKRAWHIDRIHPSPLGHRALAAAATAALVPTWAAHRPVPPCPAPPSRAAVLAWLAVNGIPWAAKRSRDLIPQVAAAVTQELMTERRGAMPRRSDDRRRPLRSRA